MAPPELESDTPDLYLRCIGLKRWFITESPHVSLWQVAVVQLEHHIVEMQHISEVTLIDINCAYVSNLLLGIRRIMMILIYVFRCRRAAS